MQESSPHLEIVKVISSLWDQLINAPSHLLLLVMLMPLGILVKRSPLPNVFIPWILIAIGAGLYPLFASPKNINPDFRHPMLVLHVYGGLLGVGSILAHTLLKKFSVYRNFEKSLTNAFRTGDTQMIVKPEPPAEL